MKGISKTYTGKSTTYKMKSILLSLFSRQTPEGEPSPKSYPFYKELAAELNKNWLTVQLGIEGEPDIRAARRYNDLPAEDLVRLVKDIDTWISVDSFLPHLMQCYCPQKRGITIFSQSDPQIFSYSNNINLLKDRKYLRKEQFEFWSGISADKSSFVSPKEIINSLKEIE